MCSTRSNWSESTICHLILARESFWWIVREALKGSCYWELSSQVYLLEWRHACWYRAGTHCISCLFLLWFKGTLPHCSGQSNGRFANGSPATPCVAASTKILNVSWCWMLGKWWCHNFVLMWQCMGLVSAARPEPCHVGEGHMLLQTPKHQKLAPAAAEWHSQEMCVDWLDGFPLKRQYHFTHKRSRRTHLLKSYFSVKRMAFSPCMHVLLCCCYITNKNARLRR